MLMRGPRERGSGHSILPLLGALCQPSPELHRSTGSIIQDLILTGPQDRAATLIRRLQSMTCSGSRCMTMQPTSDDDGNLASTDREVRPFPMFAPPRKTVPRQPQYTGSQHAILDVQPGRSSALVTRHPIPAVPDEGTSCIAMDSAAHVEADECGWVPPLDSAPVSVPMRAEGARLMFHPHPIRLRPSPPSRLELQAGPVPAATRPCLGLFSCRRLDSSPVPKWKPPVITATRAWGAGSRPRPGRPKVLARTLVPIRATALEDAGSSSPCPFQAGPRSIHSYPKSQCFGPIAVGTSRPDDPSPASLVLAESTCPRRLGEDPLWDKW